MKITTEKTLREFKAWSGGKDTLERLIELDKIEELEFILEDVFTDGLTETQLNDFLWFEKEIIEEWLGIEL